MNLSKISNYFTPQSILDIGANIGQFYSECVSIFPDCYYYLVEGNSNCEDYLKTLGVDYSIALLSDSEKIANFYTKIHEPINTGNSLYKENSEYYTDNLTRVEKIYTQTLDNLLPNKSFDLIKIDVQGAEIDIMKGGQKTISNCKGIILEVPYTDYNIGSPGAYEIYNYMKDNGFIPAEILENILHPLTYSFIQQDILFVRY